MKYEHLIYTKHEGVGTLVLNRPEKLNAFTPEMYHGLLDIVGEVEEDSEVRVLVVTGRGRAFCVGADVESLEGRFSGSFNPPVRNKSEHLTVRLLELNKPVIASINGIAAGGGLDAACACDIRLASDKANFSSLFIRRGLVPTMGGTYFLPRLMGVDRASELIWTGDMLDARQAESAGLVTRVVPHDELEAATEELAAKLVKAPPLAIAKSKRLLHSGLTTDLRSAMRDIIQAYAVLAETHDHREALRAFLEKREPVFEGR